MMQSIDSQYIIEIGGFFGSQDSLDSSLGTLVYLLDRETNKITGTITVPPGDIVGVNRYALASSDSGPFTNLSKYGIVYGVGHHADATLSRLNPGEIVFIRDNKPYCFRTPLEVIELKEGMPRYPESLDGAILPHQYRNLYDVGDFVEINAVAMRRMRQRKTTKALNLERTFFIDGSLNMF